MFKHHLATWGVQQPLLDPTTDRGGAGGGAGAAEDHDAGGDRGDAGDRGAEADRGADDDAAGGTRHAAGDDQDDRSPEEREQDELLERLEPTEREKRLRTWARRGSRYWRKATPYLDLFRGQGGALLSPTDVRKKLDLAADMEEINGLLAEHPDLLQEMLSRRNGGGKAKKVEDEFKDPFADTSTLPFDPEDAGGKFVVDQFRRDAREKHELRQELRKLTEQVTGVAHSTQHDRLQADEAQWKEQTLKAADAAGLDENEKRHFVTSIYREFQFGRASGQKMNAGDVIKRHLPFYQNVARGRARRAAGDTGRRLQNTRDTSRPHGQGAPASAQTTDGKKETLKDARTSFFTRAGRTAPAR